jgi:hypothetical protein
MFVVAGATPDLRDLAIQERHDRVIGQPAALYAVIVNLIAKAQFGHSKIISGV